MSEGATNVTDRRWLTMATSVEDQMHRFVTQQEEERCRKIEEEYKKDPQKAKKKVTRRKMPRPWTRLTPFAVCQKYELLLMIESYDYDLTNVEFEKYCASRGVWHVAGEEGSKLREFIGDFRRTKEQYQAEKEFRYAEPWEGKQYRFTRKELDEGWKRIRIARGRLQDCWEMFRAGSPASALPSR